MPMKNIFLPSQNDYLKHLEQYSQFIRPPELIDWCAKVSPYRTKRLVKTLQQYKSNTAKVLDLGCGTGLNTVGIAKAFPNTVAIDVDPQVIKPAKEFLKKFGLKIPVTIYDGKRLPFKDNSFDLIACIEVYEHAPDSDSLLKEAARVLKSDGVIHITAPNKLWPMEGHYQLPFLSYLPKKWADRYVRLFNKGSGYENIFHVPTYKQFFRAVDKYFQVEDITFDSIINYKNLGIDKERGLIVVLMAKILKWLKDWEKLPQWGPTAKRINYLLLNISLGWLFIGRPKN